MPTIDLGSVVGPQGIQGATGPRGAQGVAGPNMISATTQTTLDGVLAGNNGTVGVRLVDTTPTATSTKLITSGAVKAAIDDVLANEIMYYPDQTVAAAASAQIMRVPATGTDSSINTRTVVLGCEFAHPEYVQTNVSWASYTGYIVFTGTCTAATTANVTLGRKGN